MTSPLRKLVLVGAGGLGRETADVVRAINAVEPTWDLVGFLDDDPRLEGRSVAGIPVRGPVAMAGSLDASVAVCTARPSLGSSRPALVETLGLPADQRPALIHPGASLSGSTIVAPGCIVLAGVVATSMVSLGAHAVLMPHVVLTHDDAIGDYATLASGVCLGGGVRVGSQAYLGAGVLVREGLTVGEGALIGMGAVVLDDVPPGEVWFGAPARRREPRWSEVAMGHVPAGRG
jgi:sugar O-acyltransferase (sialic acid O-acetyltransferase NeuD family)